MAMSVTIGPLLMANGLTLAETGVVSGLMRVSSVVIQTFFGHLPDKFGGVRSLAFCELGAFLSTLFIYGALLNEKLSDCLLLFAIGMFLRMAFTSISFASSQKIAKTISVAESSGGKISIVMNQISSGTMFLMSILCFIYFDSIDLKSIILFDSATFLLSGLAQLFVIKAAKQFKNEQFTENKIITISIIRYFKDFKFLASNDFILSLVFWGSNTLNLILLSKSPQYIPLLPGLFGLAGVISGKITKNLTCYSQTRLYWLICAIVFSMYPFLLNGNPVLILFLSFFRNIGYWVIFGFIGHELMKHSKEKNFSEVASGRQAFSVSVLAIGEPYVGFAHSLFVHHVDFFMRTGMALIGFMKAKKSE